MNMTTNLDSIDPLFDTDPFDYSPQNIAQFFSSLRASAEINLRGNDYLSRLWSKHNFTPSLIKSDADLANMPFIMVHLFKQFELKSCPDAQVALNLTSSGTSGQKSQIFLDQASLARVKKLAYQIHKSLGMCSEEEVHYVCFTYDPKVADHLGTAFTDELLTSFTQKSSVFYTIQWDPVKQDFFFNLKETAKRLVDLSKQSKPVRLLGFPAHMAELIKKESINITLPKNSWVQTGGGWKAAAEGAMTKFEFREFIATHLGIPSGNNRDMFGMVEHGIPYCDCAKGSLHIPNYARVIIRNPKSLDPVPDGEVGLIQFICSYLSSYPSLSLLTTDWGRIGTCDCLIGGKTIEILGRAGVKKHKGCALTASKLLDESVPQPTSEVSS